MTKKDGNGLSHKQRTAVPIVATIGNREEAARRAGISKDCLYRWLSEKPFRDAVEQLQNEIVSDSFGLLKAAANRAVGTLIQLTTRSDCPAVQRAAANDILTHTMRFKEIMEIEKRLIEVEKTLRQDMDAKDAKKANINKRLAEIERVVQTTQTETEVEVQYRLWSEANPMGDSIKNPEWSFSAWLDSMPKQFIRYFQRDVCEMFPHLKPRYEEFTEKAIRAIKRSHTKTFMLKKTL